MSTSRDVEEHNLGTNGKPNKIWLGRNLSKEEKESYAQLLKKYQDCLAWSYSELKSYREDLFQHEIPLEAKIKPFRQIQRPINPLLSMKIQEKLKKLRCGGIIQPTRYSSWVANLVPVRNKNGDIRIFVDFRNLKKASMKDNYPLPNIDNMFQLVTRSEFLSTFDGFSGYNQVVVK